MKHGQMQIGKNGVTDEFISTLKERFAKNQIIRISVLRSAGRDRAEISKMKDKILERLGKNYTVRMIGFTFVIRKWRKPKRE